MKKLIMLILVFIFIGCSDNSVADTSSDNIQSENTSSENTISEVENTKGDISKNSSQTEKPEENINQEITETKINDKPYINPFQPIANPEPDEKTSKHTEPKKNIEKINGIKVMEVQGNKDQYLSKKYLWKLPENLIVKSGIKIEIEAGTKLFIESKNTKITFKEYSQILAIGNINEPIIFTTRKDIETGKDIPGSWRGIEFNNLDSSIFKYVQIRYAGYNHPAVKFKNCNFSNVVEFFEVYLANYDGIEIYGGDINLRNSIIFGANGDGLLLKDWSGKAQNIFIVQVDDNFGKNSSGVEISKVDNAILSNITIFSQARNVGSGINIINDSNFILLNSIIAGKRSDVILRADSVSEDNIFISNIINGYSESYLINIKLDKTLNLLISDKVSLETLANSDKIQPVNSYSYDSWFDNYPVLYLGAVNYNSKNLWFENWSIGMEKIDE
jgi:hypothetical protein